MMDDQREFWRVESRRRLLPLDPGPVRDGGAAAIRCLGRQHEAEMMNLMVSLDDLSRYSRFGFLATDDWLIQYCHGAVAAAAVILGAYVDDRLRGVGEVYDTGVPGVAEAAFLVDRSWRNHGLGTALVRSATQWADRSGRGILRLIISRANWPMRKLADRAGARLDLVNDEISADIAVCESVRVQV
jgi:GNAT superfamily N-acetyltransferase